MKNPKPVCVLNINLHSKQQLSYKGTEELIKDFSCDVTSYHCMCGFCGKCKYVTLNQGDVEDTLTYFQW